MKKDIPSWESILEFAIEKRKIMRRQVRNMTNAIHSIEKRIKSGEKLEDLILTKKRCYRRKA